MKNRDFIACNETPMLTELTAAYNNLDEIGMKIRELATFEGPVAVYAALGEEARDTMVVELEWQLPYLLLAQSAFQKTFERFGAETEWPPQYLLTVKVNHHGAHQLLQRTAERIAEAEKTLRKHLPAAKRRVEARYLSSLSRTEAAA